MNIQEIIKDYENYKKGLEGDLLKIEGIRQKQKGDLFEVKKEHLQFPDKTQKETGLSIEKWENEYDEFCNLSLFPVTCILPLQYIIAHFEYKKGIEFLSINDINSSINLLNTSAGDIFKIMKQLPEHLALFVLDRICSNLNVNLLDSYKEGEDSFVNAFNMLNNKSDFINEWLLVMKVIVDGQSVEQLFIYNDNEDIIEAIKFYFQGVVDDVKKLPKPELTNDFCDAFGNDLYKTDEKGMLYIDLEDKVEYYKKLLLRYLTLSPRFDSFTKKCADKILQHPDYLVFNNELLVECKEELKQESISKEKPDSVDDELSPLPFPYEKVKLKEAQKESFLAELYELLLNASVNPDKPYIQSNKKELFIYLFGGIGAKPVPCTPIIWLRKKNELQAYLLAFYGNNAGNDPGWAKFNNYFWLKTEGTPPQLANNCGNISKVEIEKLDNLLKPLIAKYALGEG